MTLKIAAQAALDMQSACNLSGVVRTMHIIASEVLWPEAHRLGKGTEWVNEHPIMTLFIDKLASLNRTQCVCWDNTQFYSKAYEAVQKLADTHDSPEVNT